MVKPEITRRPYREGDETGINELFNRVFSLQRPIEEWRWKFVENPAVTDPAHWIMVLEKENSIVGHYASLPVDMLCGGSIVKGCQPVDTIIDPAAKVGIKMLRDLYREGVERAARQASFGFGFPNEAAYKVGKRLLGYKDLGVMEPLYKRLSMRVALKRRLPAVPSPLAWPVHKLSQRLYSPSISTGRYTISEEGGFGSSMDKLWDDMKGEFQIAALRDSKYLNWRYRGRGYTIFIARHGEEVTGYIVLKLSSSGEEKVGYIIDVFSKEETAGLLIKGALKFFIENDADYCLSAVVGKSRTAGYLREAGFSRNDGFDSFPIVYVGRTEEEENDFLMNIANWHLAYGDTDGY